MLAQAETENTDAQPAENTQTETVTTHDGSPDADQQEVPPKGPGNSFMLIMVMMFVVLYFVMFRGPKKKQQQQKQMLAAIKKNDRIRTIGGIYGTVVEVRDDELVIKIDETNNTKLRIVRSAIGKVMAEDDEATKS